ncbi:MAG TPA: alkaline phosphatase family protein, partial [Polyangia bacterium]
MKRSNLSTGLALVAGTAMAFGASQARADHEDDNKHRGDLQWVKHLVVIYMENHSFDNLYGKWEPIHGMAVNGLSRADGAHTLQVAQDGGTYECLL